MIPKFYKFKNIVEEQLADGDAVLKCFVPLFNSMRLFGLYFTQASRRIHDASRCTNVNTDSAISREWNGGRIYSLVIMVVGWLSVARMFSVFDKTDKFGYVLLLKLAMVSSGLFSAVRQTACYVASQTGNLDRVFLDARLPNSDVARYRRLAIIHAIVLWSLLVVDALVYLVPTFEFQTEMSLSMTPIGVHILVSDQLLVFAKVMLVLLFVLADFTWFFSHSVNYINDSKILQCRPTD